MWIWPVFGRSLAGLWAVLGGDLTCVYAVLMRCLCRAGSESGLCKSSTAAVSLPHHRRGEFAGVALAVQFKTSTFGWSALVGLCLLVRAYRTLSANLHLLVWACWSAPADLRRLIVTRFDGTTSVRTICSPNRPHQLSSLTGQACPSTDQSGSMSPCARSAWNFVSNSAKVPAAIAPRIPAIRS